MLKIVEYSKLYRYVLYSEYSCPLDRQKLFSNTHVYCYGEHRCLLCHCPRHAANVHVVNNNIAPFSRIIIYNVGIVFGAEL